MKILTIIGARPQFIKAGTISREISRLKVLGEEIQEVIVHTGQHYDTNMSSIFFDEMHIPKPDYLLGIGGNSHGSMTGKMLERIEDILFVERPDWVLVYGDTNSTLAGALAASKLNVPIAHVEAGLRSYNMRMPEEINRILTDRISSLLLCPTTTSVRNLHQEGFNYWSGEPSLALVGDIMQDGAFFYSNLSKKPQDLVLKERFVLATIHRAENVDNHERLISIIKGLNEIASEIQVVLPLHPRTRNIILNIGLDISALEVIEPIGYLNMVWLLQNCLCVITDSGGLQKEAFFFEKPCITMRDETEWTELVDAGANVLTGANSEKIVVAYREVDRKGITYDQRIYGGGNAAKNIIDMMKKHL